MHASRSTQLQEDSFFRSALAAEGELETVEELQAWFGRLIAQREFAVREIPFAELDQWYFAEHPRRLAHRSGKFFTIEGIRVTTDYGPVPEWDQPIIRQQEVGILGIITRVVDGLRYFLMQAKMEPGNVNLLQLSPTVQATKSNYSQVHQGKRPIYLEYFTDRDLGCRLVDQLQSEQGARFLRKRNRNMVVEVTGEVPLYENFRWLTLGQIQRLLLVDNFVNMDARTVLSCIRLVSADRGRDYADRVMDDADHVDVLDYRLTGFAKDVFLSLAAGTSGRHSLDEILSWLAELKTRYHLSVETIPLDPMRHWIETDCEIRHESGRYFSVIAVSVEAGTREVTRWTQPLLKHTRYGLIGFLARKLDGRLHFLVRASLEPGSFDTFDLGPTVACSGARERRKEASFPRYLDLFLDAPPEQVRYRTVQSEEGGRFYHFQNEYMIVELPEDTPVDSPEDFIWMTLGQITELLPHGYFNVEARNLLACLNLSPPLGDGEGCSREGEAPAEPSRSS